MDKKTNRDVNGRKPCGSSAGLSRLRLCILWAVALLPLLFPACGAGEAARPEARTPRADTVNPALLEGTYRVYLYSFSGDYGRGLYVWSAPEGKKLWTGRDWPGLGQFRNGGSEEINGVTFRWIAFTPPADYMQTGYLKYILNRGGGGQTADLEWPDPAANRTLYLIEGAEDRPYTDARQAAANAVNDVNFALFDDAQTVSFNLRTRYQGESVEIFENDRMLPVRVSIRTGALQGSLVLSEARFAPGKNYHISFNRREKRPVGASGAFIDDPASGLVPGPEVRLGSFLEGTRARFSVWSPFANRVLVNYYDSWNQPANAPSASHALTKGAGGVWSGAFPCASGQLYQYELHFDDGIKRALDPYARSLGRFSSHTAADKIGKGAVLDPAAHGRVSGYHQWSGKREDAVIYEIHVRDFTVDPSIEKELRAPFGSYRAFIERLPHIRDLGVTHVQLLPVMAYYNKDEGKRTGRELEYRAKGNNYNWGYDPHSYFAPEGMYASDVADPAVRVRELKELVEAIHKNGMGVILDVVYNHTANTAVLDNLVPGYYYRAGRNKSGCGNDTASERTMMRRLIVDSIAYWVDEYKVDGFRFDLMGLHDQATVLAAHAAAKQRNPRTLFIGEGWKMNTDLAIEGGWADQSGMLKTDAFGVFSDGFRDILKGGGFNEGAPGFLTGKPASAEAMLAFFTGKKLTASDAADHPGDAVQYIAAHDGLTWHDTVAVSLKITNSAAIYRRLKLGNLCVLTAQGVAFLHAGQEFGRTKYYEGRELSEIVVDSQNKVKYLKNSYDASDRVNMIDWTRVASPAGRELYAYTQGLIALRRSSDAFRLGAAAFDRVTRVPAVDEKEEDFTFGMRTVDGKGVAWFVLVNADTAPRRFTHPGLSGAACLVDAVRAGATPLAAPRDVTLAGDTVTLAPLTGAVFRK